MSADTHDHDSQAVPSDPALRVKALESLLVAKGLVDPAALDALIDTYEHKIGPRNGARVVARAWTDPAFRKRLLTDATTAIAELGYGGSEGDQMVVVENTPTVHNLVVCTLCSCYPWPVQVLKASDVAAMIAKGYSSRRDIPAKPHFAVGQHVRARNIHPVGHTRLPRYARGKAGTIASDYGVFVFPDSEAQGLGEKPQHVYSVRFSASELWGPAVNPRDTVCIDLWDDHLEPA